MQITKTLASKLIEESPSFREYILNQLFNFTDELIEIIKQICERNKLNKIAAIKELREYSMKNIEKFKNSSFPDITVFRSDNGTEIIGLASAKKLIEQYWV